MTENDSLKSKVFAGLFWKFAERISAQFITLLVSIVLARLLSPEDYGAVALIMVFITIANVFVSSGFGNALIQKKDADNLDFSSVFYVNILISLVLYAIIYLAAPAIADFYSMQILGPALRVLAIRIPVAAINSVQQAYVSRHMLFRRFFWATLFGTILSGFVGIFMAYSGYGIWALVAQYLTNTCTDTVVLWFTVRWRPERRCSLERTAKLFSYGWKLLCSGLIDTGYSQLTSLLIGKFYTASDLAYYNQGSKFPQMIVININSAIDSVLFPALSRFQDNKERLKAMTRRSIQVSSYIMWPMMLGFAAVAEPFIRIVLTDKWLPCIPYLRIFCISFGLWPIHTANLQAIKAIGRSDLFLRMEIIKKVLGLLLLVAALPHGPLAIAGCMIISDLVCTFVNAAPNVRLLGYSIREQYLDILPIFLVSLVMAVIVNSLERLGFNDFITLAMQIAAGGAIYLAASLIFRPEGFIFILRNLKERMHR